MFEKYSDEIKKAILIRTVEEKLLELFSQGKLNGTVHTCVGQELSGIFISKYLEKKDHIVSKGSEYNGKKCYILGRKIQI